MDAFEWEQVSPVLWKGYCREFQAFIVSDSGFRYFIDCARLPILSGTKRYGTPMEAERAANQALIGVLMND
jgi:hypothetical protein